MTLYGAPQLNAKLVKLEQRLDSLPLAVAKASEGDVAEAVVREIGDSSLSRWYGGTTQIVGQSMRGRDGSTAEVVPVRRALGPSRILQSGRNLYGSGDRRNAGLYTSKKTGLVTQRTRKVKRAGGRSPGKGTWDDTTQLVASRLPKRSAAALHQVMAKTFGVG